MNTRRILFLVSMVVLVICVTLLTNAYMAKPQADADATAKPVETAYSRMMRTGILRCGYFAEAPFTLIGPDNKPDAGIAFDLANQIAKELGLKVEWAQEVNFATIPEDLAAGRYDAVCASLFVLPRGGKTDYTRPYTFVSAYGYVRKGDMRFDGAFDRIDWPSRTIAGVDGEGATTAARKLLPQAKFEILPQSAQVADMLNTVVTGKADIGFVMPGVFASFDRNNPGVLVKAGLDKPLYTYALSFGLPTEQPGLKDMLDNVIVQLTASGELQAIIDKYDPTGMFIRPSVK
jgi:ABC-type amino acid transport substrate-binding protein